MASVVKQKLIASKKGWLFAGFLGTACVVLSLALAVLATAVWIGRYSSSEDLI